MKFAFWRSPKPVVKKAPARKAAPKKAAAVKKSPPQPKPSTTKPASPQKVASKSKKGRVLALLGVVAVIVALVVASLVIGGDSSSSNPATSTSTSTTSTTLPPTIEVPAGELEVKPGDLIPEAARCKSDEFIPDSLPGSEKLWGDSESTPYVSSEPYEIFQEDLIANCGNPTHLDGRIQSFCTVNIEDFNICEHNSWTKDFLDLAAKSDDLSVTFLTKKTGKGDDLFVTAEYQQFAELVNTILLDFQVWDDLESWMTKDNWHLDGPRAGVLPRSVRNTHQEDLPSFILIYTIKDVCPEEQAAAIIGNNVGDKRSETFESKCNPPAEPPCTENCGSGGTTTTTVPDGRKSNVTTEITPPAVTPPGTTTTTPLPPGQTGGGGSGTGAPPPATTVAPNPTVAPPGSGATSTSSPPGSSTTIQGP